MWIRAYSPADGHEFRNIESPFAEFELRHERLTLTDALAQFRLRDAGVLPSLHQQVDYSQVKVGTK